MRHTWLLKAYVYNFNAQKNATPKMDKFSKCIFLGGLQSWMVDSLFTFSKFFENVVEIIKIAGSNELMALKASMVTPHKK